MFFGRMAMANQWKRFSNRQDDVIELRRLCCVDNTPKNAESFFISRALKLLKQDWPGRIVVSYADKEYQHLGTIYKASNFQQFEDIHGARVIIYQGKSYHDKTIRTQYKGKLKPFAAKIKTALTSGQAFYKNTAGKYTYVYLLRKPMTKNKIKAIKDLFYKKIIERDALKKEVLDLQKQFQINEEKHLAGITARKLVVLAAQNTLGNIEDYLGKTVNLGLQAVIPNASEFSVKFVERRNKLECDFLLNGDPDIEESFSGGEMDICAFILRCAFIFLKKSRRLIVLDEPMKNISPNYQERASEMIQTIIDRMKLQIIMVNNMPNLNTSANKTIRYR